LIKESDYPYTAQDGTCAYGSTPHTTDKVSTFDFVEENSATATMSALDAAPVTVSIEADSFGFQLYSSGIFNSESCGTSLDHAVALVGYGSNYFILRNSWGLEWVIKVTCKFPLKAETQLVFAVS